MGNRAVITTIDALDKSNELKKDAIGIYVHWHGSRTDVEEFLKEAQEKGVCNPEYDDYGWARLVQVVANKLDKNGCTAGTGVGINTLGNLDCDNGDNGVYIIKDWTIVGRMYSDEEE